MVRKLLRLPPKHGQETFKLFRAIKLKRYFFKRIEEDGVILYQLCSSHENERTHASASHMNPPGVNSEHSYQTGDQLSCLTVFFVVSRALGQLRMHTERGRSKIMVF